MATFNAIREALVAGRRPEMDLHRDRYTLRSEDGASLFDLTDASGYISEAGHWYRRLAPRFHLSKILFVWMPGVNTKPGDRRNWARFKGGGAIPISKTNGEKHTVRQRLLLQAP